jgi:hypothetical protein
VSDSFNVQTDQLLKHADAVLQLANDARSAANTAQAALNGNAYGVIGQFLAALLLQATGDAKDGITKAAQTISDVNTGLLNTVKAYQHTDTKHSNVFKGIIGETK